MIDLTVPSGSMARRELAVRFMFSVSVRVDEEPDRLERCQAWAQEIANGMQEHHFPADDIDGCTPLVGSEMRDEFSARWVGHVEAIEL